MGVRGARERERRYLEQQRLTREGIYALGEKAVEALIAMLGDPKKGDYVRKDVAFFVIDHIIGKPEHRNQSLNANMDMSVDPEKVNEFFRRHYGADG